jgi:Putative zinc-finger
MTDCARVRTSLGVYVVGAIDPAERAEVETHLETCPACRDEVAGMAGLPALLGRVNETQIEQIAGPPPELLDALLARAARDRRRSPWRVRGRRWVPVAAAACGLLLVGGLLGGLLTSLADQGEAAGRQRPPAPSAASPARGERLVGADPRTGVRASVVLYQKKWGTGVELRLSGAPHKARCRLYAVARDGGRDVLGSWYVAYDKGSGQYYGGTMFRRDQLFSIEIVTTEGQPLLTIPA